MPRIRKVIDARGQPVRYDHDRVVASILNAIRVSGHRDEHLADEIASVVEFTLDRYYGEQPPTNENIAHAIEQALRSLEGSIDGASQIADAYVANRVRHSDIRELDSAEETSEDLPAGGLPEVLSHREVGFANWKRQRIEAALIKERGIPREQASAVAQAVEEQIAQLSLSNISTTLIRELVDLQLIEAGLASADHGGTQYALPRWDVGQAIFPQSEALEDSALDTPAMLEEWAARGILRQYALTEIHHPDVVAAHASGQISIEGLDQPARVFDLDLNVVSLLRRGGGSGLESFYPEATESLADACARIQEALACVTSMVRGRIRLVGLDSALGDFARNPRQAVEAAQQIAEGIYGLSLSVPVVVSLDSCAGRIEEPGSMSLCRGFLQLLSDPSRRARRAIRLEFRVGPASASDPDAFSVLERAVARALADGSCCFAIEDARENSRSADLFGNADSRSDWLLRATSASTGLNLSQPLHQEKLEGENEYFERIDQALMHAAAGIAEREDFLARFYRRRRSAKPGLATRLGQLMAESFEGGRVVPFGLRQAAEWLSGEKDPSKAAFMRAAQRLLYYVRPRLQELGAGHSVPIDLYSDYQPQVALDLQSRTSDSDSAAQPQKRVLSGLSLAEPSASDWQARIDLEAQLGGCVANGEFVIHAGSEHVGQSALLQTILKASAATPRRIHAISVEAELRQCAACGNLAELEENFCPACGQSDWRERAGQRTLFEDNVGAAGASDDPDPPSQSSYEVM